MDTTVSLSWPAILTLALTSGVITTALSLIVDWVRSARAEKRSQERDARYLAVRLAASLEKFAIDCADVVGKNDVDDNRAFEGTTLLPKLPEIPVDAEWKALDPELAAGVLSLPNEITIGQLTADEYTHLSGSGPYSIIRDHAGKCGYRALTLAGKLRSRYQLPVRDFGPRFWDFEEQLKKQHDALVEQIASRGGKKAS